MQRGGFFFPTSEICKYLQALVSVHLKTDIEFTHEAQYGIIELLRIPSVAHISRVLGLCFTHIRWKQFMTLRWILQLLKLKITEMKRWTPGWIQSNSTNFGAKHSSSDSLKLFKNALEIITVGSVLAASSHTIHTNHLHALLHHHSHLPPRVAPSPLSPHPLPPLLLPQPSLSQPCLCRFSSNLSSSSDLLDSYSVLISAPSCLPRCINIITKV